MSDSGLGRLTLDLHLLGVTTHYPLPSFHSVVDEDFGNVPNYSRQDGAELNNYCVTASGSADYYYKA